MTYPLLRKPIFALIWFIPLAYLLLLREIPQLFSGAGFVVGMLLGLYSAGCLWLLWRTPSLQTSSPLDMGLLAMFLALVIAAVFSIDPSRSWRLVWNWSACIVAFYCTFILLRAGASAQQLLKVLLTVISLLIAAGYQDFLSWAWRWYSAFGTSLRPLSYLIPRASGITGSPNILGFFVVIGIILAITYRTAAQNKWPWAARLWIVFAFPMILLTRSRSAFIALAVALAIVALGRLWVWVRGRLSLQLVVRVAVGLVVLGMLTIGLIFLLRPTTSLSERNISYRLQLWQYGFQNWLEHPLAGSGGDTFATAMLLRDPNVPPLFPLRAAHNWWINILSDTGLLGITAVLLCWFLLLQFLWRYQGYENWSMTKLGLLGALGAFCVHSFLDTPEYWVIFTAALLLATLFSLLESQPVDNNRFKKGLFLWWIPVSLGLLWFGYQAFQATRIYEQGVAAAVENDWGTAAQLFDEAQQEVLYPNTSYYLAAGMSYAILAQQDERYLPNAITAFQNVIAAEPGWPTNHANLAALYWQNNQPELAVATMQTAVALAPQIPIYELNLGLWFIELGEDAAAQKTFYHLYQQRATWRDAPFWQEEIPAQSIISLSQHNLLTSIEKSSRRADAPAGWHALEKGNYEVARAIFEQQMLHSPYDGTGYLGQSIVAYMQNHLAQAQQLVKKANLLGTRDLFWQIIIMEEGDSAALQSTYLAHSTFDISNGQSTLYPRTVLLRMGVPYDVAPQLNCFSLTPILNQNVTILSSHLSPEDKVKLQASFIGNGRGLRPCVTVID